MVALGVTVKVLPFVINPRQGVFGWVYDRTNAQQYEWLGSVGNKSVQHTPWQDDTLMQVHHTQLAARTLASATCRRSSVITLKITPFLPRATRYTAR